MHEMYICIIVLRAYFVIGFMSATLSADVLVDFVLFLFTTYFFCFVHLVLSLLFFRLLLLFFY